MIGRRRNQFVLEYSQLSNGVWLKKKKQKKKKKREHEQRA